MSEVSLRGECLTDCVGVVETPGGSLSGARFKGPGGELRSSQARKLAPSPYPKAAKDSWKVRH